MITIYRPEAQLHYLSPSDERLLIHHPYQFIFQLCFAMGAVLILVALFSL